MGGVAGGCGGGRGLATGSVAVAPRRSTATATGRPDLRVRVHLPTYLALLLINSRRGRRPIDEYRTHETLCASVCPPRNTLVPYLTAAQGARVRP